MKDLLETLKNLDKPYVPKMWNFVQTRWPGNTEKQIRKYVAYMGLCIYRDFKWKDSYIWREE
jgi:hypothetical protein